MVETPRAGRGTASVSAKQIATAIVETSRGDSCVYSNKCRSNSFEHDSVRDVFDECAGSRVQRFASLRSKRHESRVLVPLVPDGAKGNALGKGD
jgi:hypothetical protein